MAAFAVFVFSCRNKGDDPEQPPLEDFFGNIACCQDEAKRVDDCCCKPVIDKYAELYNQFFSSDFKKLSEMKSTDSIFISCKKIAKWEKKIYDIENPLPPPPPPPPWPDPLSLASPYFKVGCCQEEGRGMQDCCCGAVLEKQKELYRELIDSNVTFLNKILTEDPFWGKCNDLPKWKKAWDDFIATQDDEGELF